MPEVIEPPPPPDPLGYDRLVMRVAIRHGAEAAHVRDSDQYSAGWLGLVQAVQRFKPWLGRRLSTYAYHYVDGYIRTDCRRRLAEPGGIGAAIERVAGHPVDRDGSPPEDRDRGLCQAALAMLSPRDALIVRRIVMDGWTSRATGAEAGLTFTRCNQIVHEAVALWRRRFGVAPRGKRSYRKRHPVFAGANR